jgi:hypothetical protein
MNESELREEIERLQTKVDRQGEVIGEQADRITSLEGKNEDLREHNRRITKDLAGAQSRITELEEIIEEQPSQPTESDESAETDEPPTPMHRLIKAGEEGVLGSVTPSVRRAKVLAEHFGKWSKKTPSGLVIRSNLRELLSAATGESLYWEQVKRACNRLAEYTKGTIAFKKTRKHGNVLVAKPDDHRYRALLASGG